MFTLAGNFYKWMKKRREKNLTIIILGLDNAGKTTLLFSLKDEISATDTAPTVGFRQSKIVMGKYTIQWFDVGGAKNFRRVWTNYYNEVHGVIFVVDAAAEDRLEESKEVLQQTLKAEGIPGKPVLVFANKQDLPGCLSDAELSKRLGMLDWKDSSFQVHACQAKPGPGEPVDARVGRGLKWLLDQIDSKYKTLNTRVEREMEEAKEKEKKEKEQMRARAEASKAARLKEQAEKEEQEKREQEAAAAGGGVAASEGKEKDKSADSAGGIGGEGASGAPKLANIDVTPVGESRAESASGAEGSGVRQGASLGPDTPMTNMSEVAPDKVLPEALTPARPAPGTKLGPQIGRAHV